MSTFALPQKSIALPRKKPLSKRVEIGITLVLVIIGLLLSILSLAYLFYANAKATQDYHLRVLQEKRAQLIAEVETLEMRAANDVALVALSENPRIARMVPQEDILYLEPTTAVAKNGSTN